MKQIDLNQEKHIFQLENFSGPMDLLLNLARQNEIEITLLNLNELITQYLNLISTIDNHNLETKSEYLIFAAELIFLKSHALLPNQEAISFTTEENDEFLEATSLLNRLLKYRSYSEQSSNFAKLIKKRDQYQLIPQFNAPCDNKQVITSIDLKHLKTKQQEISTIKHNLKKATNVQIKENKNAWFMDYITSTKNLSYLQLCLKFPEFRVEIFLVILEAIKLKRITIVIADNDIIIKH